MRLKKWLYLQISPWPTAGESADRLGSFPETPFLLSALRRTGWAPALHSFLSRQNLKVRWTMLGILASNQGFYWSSLLVLSPVIHPSIVREMDITAPPNAK